MPASPRSDTTPHATAAEGTGAALVFGLVIAAGVLARIVQYAQRRPLFTDDVQLALNVLTRGYRDLLRPLDLEQSAPALFLWIQRFMSSAFGVSDVSLTIVSLIAGLAVLPLAWLIARRVVDRETSMFAVALLAVSPPLIYYSSSAKQYEMGVFVCALAALLGLRALESPDRSSRWVAAIGGGVIALTLSMPVLFVLGGVWCAWALDRSIRTSARGRLLLMASGGLWGATFLSMYLGMYSVVSRNVYMRRYWHGAYMSSQTTLWNALRYVGRGVHEPLFDVGSPALWPVTLALSTLTLVGVVMLVRQRRFAIVALLTVPVVLAIAASSLGQWILYSRFMVFSAPLVAVLLAHGMTTLARRVGRHARYREALVMVGGLAALALPGRYTAWVTRHPSTADASRQIVQSFMAHARPEEPVYVFPRAVPLWTYYSTDWRRPDTARVRRLLRNAIEIGPGSGNASPRGRPVVHEGFERQYPFRGATELIGVATGMENTGALRAAAPDSGWADNEAERIRQVAAPTVWVAFVQHRKVPREALQKAIERRGGHITFADVRPGAALFQYRFDVADSSVVDQEPDRPS